MTRAIGLVPDGRGTRRSDVRGTLRRVDGLPFGVLPDPKEVGMQRLVGVGSGVADRRISRYRSVTVWRGGWVGCRCRVVCQSARRY